MKTVIITLFFFLIVILPDVAFASDPVHTPVGDLIARASLFIKNIILPFLFSLALLFFLINTAKYFIVEGSSEEGRKKAKQSALYGIIAFVFLFSLWGIVGMLISGIGLEQRKPLCPDYLLQNNGTCADTRFGNATNPSFPRVSPGTGSGRYTGGTSGSNGSGGGLSGTGSNNSGYGSTESGSNNTSGKTFGLAELIFGTGKDSAIFTEFQGNPRSAFNVPSISKTATCEDGLNTLLLASKVESTQAAYALYKNTAAATRWENITDLNSTNHISYDKDILRQLLQNGAQKVYIVHTHPKGRVEQQKLVMNGHGPSAADMRAMCEMNTSTLSHLTVDWKGVWETRQQPDTCPYSSDANIVLPLLETYNDIAALDSSTRLTEIQRYQSSPLVPETYKEHFKNLSIDGFTTLSPEEILAQSAPYQTYASTSIQYQKTITDFCNSY